MKDRIYVCHTYYHVYVTFLKELKKKSRGKEEWERSGWCNPGAEHAFRRFVKI